MSDAAGHWISRQLGDHIDTAHSTEKLLPLVREVGRVLVDAYRADRILYTFGNGGSAADAQHLTGEIIGHYKRDRRPLGALTLSTDPTTLTCIANDYSFDDVFSRQITALARPGDVVAAFSTSGASANIISALKAAQQAGATTVLFGGGTGGPALEFAEYSLIVQSTVTPRIQEMHTFMLHVISEMVDAWADGDNTYL
jgi:D-sedoheptulose 7-phosphate isomerase